LRCASHKGLRKDEILELTWDRLDLMTGFIRLKATAIKMGVARSTPIGCELEDVLRRLPIAVDWHGNCLFIRRRQRITWIREIFARVYHVAGLNDVVFHDLFYTATASLRRAGVDALTAMNLTRHTTVAVFKRYNTIDEDDLTAVQYRMSIYMVTKSIRRQREYL
jgi:integrase